MFLISKYINLSFASNKSLSKVINYTGVFSRAMSKIRDEPIVKKLESAEFKNLFNDEINSLSSLFTKYNYELRIAGGAVRDLLLGEQPKDIDFATNATPEQMKQMFNTEGIRMINTKGEKHGTITARLNDKENFEVTTLRIDVTTDGRHAEVQFTTDWILDANRRDLTINSMFLDLNGNVYDYFYGYEDLQKRRIRFVGDADTRIKEDYLRILRYFRFYGRIADQPDNHDELTLRVISQNVSGLEQISGERIWSELKRTLEGRFAGELMKTMLHVGLAKYCGLPATPNIDEFTRVWETSRHLKLHPITLLAALLENSEQAQTLNDRLKMSAYDRDLAHFIIKHRQLKPDLKPLTPYQKLVVHSKGKSLSTREWVIEVLKYQNSSLLEQFQEWTPPKFPVNGNILRDKFNYVNGRSMGAILDELKLYWVEHDFKPDANQLLELVPEIKCNIDERNAKNK